MADPTDRPTSVATAPAGDGIRRGAGTRAALIVATCLAVAALGALVARLTADARPEMASEYVSVPDGFPKAAPIDDRDGKCAYGGRTVSISEAAAAAPAPLLLPEHPLADAGSISAIWDCGSSLDIVFESGVRLMIAPSEVADPAKHFARVADSFASHPSSTYTVGTLLGRPAGFFDPDGPSGDAPRGGAAVIVDEGYYALTGSGAADTTLLKEIGETLRPFDG